MAHGPWHGYGVTHCWTWHRRSRKRWNTWKLTIFQKPLFSIGRWIPNLVFPFQITKSDSISSRLKVSGALSLLAQCEIMRILIDEYSNCAIFLGNGGQLVPAFCTDHFNVVCQRRRCYSDDECQPPTTEPHTYFATSTSTVESSTTTQYIVPSKRHGVINYRTIFKFYLLFIKFSSQISVKNRSSNFFILTAFLLLKNSWTRTLNKVNPMPERFKYNPHLWRSQAYCVLVICSRI